MPRNKFLTLIVTNTAVAGTEKIANYIEKKFSLSVSIDYLKGIKLAFDALVALPEIGVKYKGDVRKLVWRKHTIIFYRYDYNYLYILAVIDSRSSLAFKFLD